MKKIYFDKRWIGGHGIGRFAKEISEGFPEFETYTGLNIKPSHPLDFIILTTWMFLHPKAYVFSPGYNAPIFFHSRFTFVVHDLNHIQFSQNSSFLKTIYYELIIKRACIKCKKIITVSEFTKLQLVSWANIDPKKISVIGNGVSELFFDDGHEDFPNYPYFLCVSNRRKHKNEFNLLKAYSDVIKKEEGEIYNLVLTGEPNEEILFEIDRLGLTNRVFFFSNVTDEKLASLYNGAMALIFPSLYEGFGLPVVEAMACGTPVITSNVTSLPEVSGDAAILIDPNKSEQITNAMLRVICDSDTRNDLVEKGLLQARKYSWANVINRLKEVINTSI